MYSPDMLPLDTEFKLLVVGHDDGSYSALICIDGFQDEESAGLFCDEFMENGSLEVGDLLLEPQDMSFTIN